MERRSFMASLLGALAGTALPRHSKLEQFLAEANPLAKRLVADTTLTGQDRYLLSLASLAVQLDEVPVPDLRDSGQGMGPGTFIGFNPGGDPFTILHWRMEPNACIRPHAHTYGNVVTLCLEGAARVENYECAGERKFEAGPVRVRRTREQWLTPGAVNLVNLERDYVHGFTAGPRGARGLDLTTRIKPKGPTPYLKIGKQLDDGLYDAAWTI